jgi:hypothetical protein
LGVQPDSDDHVVRAAYRTRVRELQHARDQLLGEDGESDRTVLEDLLGNSGPTDGE